ncbi:MAG: hypothetical protein IJS00_03710 [Paludibacteraceae bacterium]|nr:hypothetical protein [Paludibacteraceae bacterium]
MGDSIASYNDSSNTLTISGNITAPDNNTSCIDNSINNLTINVASAATLTAYDKTINLKSSTTITGSAQLTVLATKVPDPHNPVDTNYPIYAAVNLNISNANLFATGTILCIQNLNITNSTLSVDYTIWGGGGNMNVTNSTVSVTNGSIMGYISCTLTDCYFKTPQGGYYDTSKRRLVDANGNGVISVEIVATGEPTSLEDLHVTGDHTQKILHDGVLYIIRDGKVYNSTGIRVK